MKKKLVCVGYVSETRDDWEKFAPDITPPSNYKDAAKIKTYVKNAREKQLNTADTATLLCRFRDFYAIDENGKGTELMRGARMAYLSRFTDIAVMGGSLMRHLLMREQIEEGRKLYPEHLWTVMSLRTGYPFLVGAERAKNIFDPVHALLCTSTLDEQLDSVARTYGFGDNLDSAFGRASFAWHLCKLLGIANG